MNVLRGTFFIFPDEMKHGSGENKRPPPSFSQWQNRHLERLFAQDARSGKQVRSKMHGIFAGGVKDGFPHGGQGGETGGVHIQNIAVFQLYLETRLVFLVRRISYAFNGFPGNFPACDSVAPCDENGRDSQKMRPAEDDGKPQAD